MACGILAPQPGIEPGPSAVKASSPNHWTARELPGVEVYARKEEGKEESRHLSTQGRAKGLGESGVI